MTEKQRTDNPQKKGKKQTRVKTPEKKEKQLLDKLKAANKEIEVIKDQLLRTAAEFDNYRKRMEREVARIISNANENLIIELLPIIDDVERSLKSTPKGGKEKEVHKGFELIYQKLILTLQGFGVEAMTSIGKEFDVEEHDAILQVEQKETPSSIVVEEHEKGYLLDGKVIRHAKVIVSK